MKCECISGAEVFNCRKIAVKNRDTRNAIPFSIPSGKVKCSFSFPGSNMKSGEWKKSDGRVWIGDYYVEKELEIE